MPNKRAQFLTDLSCRETKDDKWEVIEPLVYQSRLWETLIEVPAGFITDFASVPRVPFVYMLYGDRAHRESVLHDYLYYMAMTTRKIADCIFLEAMESRGKSWFVRQGMYRGVRMGGWVAWNEHRKSGHPRA